MRPHLSAHQRLGEALCLAANATIAESTETSWASATFTGARHCFTLSLEHPHDADMFDGVAEREFDFPGHIVADIAVTAREAGPDFNTITIEAWTVEDL